MKEEIKQCDRCGEYKHEEEVIIYTDSILCFKCKIKRDFDSKFPNL